MGSQLVAMEAGHLAINLSLLLNNINAHLQLVGKVLHTIQLKVHMIIPHYLRT